ncbi:hypothetical protein TWF694_008443 [Orbilia ellipsospora]|uniref:Clr5 domain-containing protein n=1 Tax=Orbilia ellipsospora TaxID=2528407 RepID=A0AAV9XGJ1_9PEZI
MDNIIVEQMLPKPTRTYLKVDRMNDHKEFITAKYNAGLKQRAILQALKVERGVTLELYKLKRMLKGWKAQKNLTIRRKLYIRNKIEKRKLDGKQTHRVILANNQREVTQEELDGIMSATVSFFKDVEPSPIDAVFSTPVSAETTDVSEAVMETSVEAPMHIAIDEEVDDDKSAETALSSDGMELEMNEEHHQPDPWFFDKTNSDDIYDNPNHESCLVDDSLITRYGPLGNPTKAIYTSDDFIEALIRLGCSNEDALVGEANGETSSENNEIEGDDEWEDDEWEDDEWEDDPFFPNQESGDIGEVENMTEFNETDLVENLAMTSGSSISDTRESKSEGQHQFTVQEGYGSIEDAHDETPLRRYARQKRPQFWTRIEKWKEEAREFIEKVDTLSQEHSISLQNAENIVSAKWEREYNYEAYPYHIYKQILGEGARTMAGIDGVDSDLLCGIVEDNFTPLRRAANELSPDNRARIDFDSYLVHFPFVIDKYGLNHFFTASILIAAIRVFYQLVYTFNFSDLLDASAFCIYDSIGMGAHSDALSCIIVDRTKIEPTLAVAYDAATSNLQEMVLQIYGPDHPKTLRLFSTLAWYMLMGSAETRRQSELITYGIIQTIKARYTTYQGSSQRAMIVCFTNLGDILGVFDNFYLSSKILVEPSIWEAEYEHCRALLPTGSSMHHLGIAYGKIGKYEEGLRALLTCFNGYRDQFDINHPESLEQIAKITQIMDLRGPVLYNHLDTFYDGLLESLDAAGRANSRGYQSLYKARKRGGIDASEYAHILALRRSGTRTPDLQDFVYAQGLECWLYDQEVPFVAQQGGWVQEINYEDMID